MPSGESPTGLGNQAHLQVCCKGISPHWALADVSVRFPLGGRPGRCGFPPQSLPTFLFAVSRNGINRHSCRSDAAMHANPRSVFVYWAMRDDGTSVPLHRRHWQATLGSVHHPCLGQEGEGFKLKVVKRHVVIVEEPLVIRNALHVLLADIESEGNIPPGTRESMEVFLKEGCNRLILDLRTAEEPPSEMQTRIRSLRARRLGCVLVVTCDVTALRMLHQAEEPCRPHFFPKKFVSTLSAFVHALF